jgi:hypothetical protein
MSTTAIEHIRLFKHRHKREIALIILVLFVASISFAAGYLIRSDADHAPIIIEKCSTQ